MDSTVIDESNFHHIVSTSLQQSGHGISEEIVPDMSEVERLVRIR